MLFALKYNGEVFVSDLATKHMLRLPDSIASWKLFLRGNTLSVLLAYVVRDFYACLIIDVIDSRLMNGRLMFGVM